MKRPAPRLHVVPASGCDKALVLRRGPSRNVLSLLWDRARGTFETGQWLKGRIYEYRCDLSPDGQHMVYFAGTGQTWWTALSRAPWLRAIAFYPQDHTWGGGGAFDGAGKLWLNGAPDHAPLPDGLGAAHADAFALGTDGFHMGDSFVATMVLRGWVRVAGQGYASVLTKALVHGWRLELRFVVSERNRAIVSNSYTLVHPERDTHVALAGWEWAEPYAGKLQFALQGALWEVELDAQGLSSDKQCLKDFTQMQFQVFKAPYAGISDRKPAHDPS